MALFVGFHHQHRTKTGDGIVHKVAAKETLFSIARQYNVTVDEIKAWNNLTETSLALGQEILIKKHSDAGPTYVKPETPAAAKTHTVAPKETLYSIARLYGMSVPQLKEWNNIAENELKVGQVLAVATPAAATSAVPTAAPGGVPTVVAPAAVNANTTPVVSSSVTVSESLNGSNEAREIGTAALLEGTEGNRKYLAQHRTIKPGTILKIRNLMTNQEVFVRVTGPPSSTDDGTLILISKSAYDRLGATEPKFRAEITFYK